MQYAGNEKKKISGFIVMIVAITMIGAVLRLICCNWGSPLQLHPDEHTIVDSTIRMLSRHSWEAQVFNRPDHFEIKSNSIIFSLFSKLRYNMPAYEAFNLHRMAFYKLARIYTVFFGTAMIPLAALFTGKLLSKTKQEHRRIAQLAAAWLTCFSCIFIEHSAYATPDVVLAFFALLFAYTMLGFIDGKEKNIYYSAAIIGIGVTIKYPAAVLCLPLAGLALYKYIREKRSFLSIIKTGALCAAAAVGVAFIIAPNLFTDYMRVIRSIITEARPTHLGADGLGFFGNLSFYAKQLILDQGWTVLIFASIAIAYIAIVRDKRRLTLLTGLILWIGISLLSLHWVRWGTPVYVFGIILAAIGVAGALSFLEHFRERSKTAERIVGCLNV